MALAQNTELLGQYTEGVNENGVTQAMANTVMESYQEKMNRIKARFDDYKISIFNATQAFLPYLEQSGKVLNSVTQVGSGIGTLKNLMGVFKTTTNETSTSIGILGTIKKVYATVVSSVTGATARATTAQLGLNLAMLANPVGIVIAAIIALVGIIWLLWEKCRAFREIMYGIWEAAKAVFNNIGIVVMRMWNLVIKPVFEWVWNLVKTVFNNIWNTIKWCFNAAISVFKFFYNTAVSVFTSIYNTVVAVFSWIWETIKSVGEAIGSFFGGVWDFIKNLFGKVGSFLNEWIVQPIKNAFSSVWDFIVGIFNKIWDGLTKLFKPIIDLWNKVFSKEGMQNVNDAFKEGMKKGGDSFDADQKEKAEKEKKEKTPAAEATTASKAIDMKSIMAQLDAKGGGGNAGGKGVNTKGAGAVSGNVGSKNTVINMIFHKLQDQTVIHTTNLEVGAKQAGKQIVEKILMALHSVTGDAIAS
jgi:phage-related protein